MTSEYKAALVANAANDKLAKDVSVLDVRDLTIVTDYFVIASADNKIQVHAICIAIKEALENRGIQIYRSEGWNEAKWVLLDFGDVIAHVFRKEERDNYDLDRLWGDAIHVDEGTINTLVNTGINDGE